MPLGISWGTGVRELEVLTYTALDILHSF